jgi:hypothetical protein
MSIAINFRGVAVFVQKSQTNQVEEVLFPSAEDPDNGPPDGEVADDGSALHADLTRANHHYAGLLIRSPGVPATYRKLFRTRVEFSDGQSSNTQQGFAGNFPLLKDATTGKQHGLSLLLDRESDRVATRILFSGGTLEADTPDAGEPAFSLDDHFGGSTPAKPYSTSATWRTPSTSLTIQITPLDTLAPAESIVIPDRSAVYIYHFDNGLPSENELTRPIRLRCKHRAVDHDFKWIYKLLEKGSFSNWPDWLGGHDFPAPMAPCPGRSGLHVRLVPVSTCFPTVWPDP